MVGFSAELKAKKFREQSDMTYFPHHQSHTHSAFCYNVKLHNKVSLLGLNISEYQLS